MSIATVPVFEWPTSPRASALGFTNVALNGAGYKSAGIFAAPKTGNIHKIGIRLGTVTTPTDLDLRVETVSAQFPTGTLQGTNTNGTIASGSLTANAMNMVTLTADAAVTAGDLLAVVAAPAGSPNFNATILSTSASGLQLPYAVGYSGSWSVKLGPPIWAVEYDDGTYALISGMWPVTGASQSTFNSGSTPDEIGAKFSLPVSCRVSGFSVMIDLDNAADVVLYDSDGVTPLLTKSITSDGRRDTSGFGPYFCPFATKATLIANATYYLVVKPGGSSVTTYYITTLSASAQDQLPGGQAWQYVSAKDPSGTGSWTAVTTQYPLLGLLIDGIDVPSGGGLLTHPGMGGGLRG